MGLGKTVQCIGAMNKVCDSDSTVLVVCPKSVLGVWESELQSWLEVPLEIQMSSTQSFPLASKGTVTLINYDICHKFRDLLAGSNYDVLICDEAHYLKSVSAKRTLAVLGDGETHRGIKTNYLWLLTGTPVLNRPVELYPLLRALQEEEFPSFNAFAERYCDPKQMQVGRAFVVNYSGAANLVELARRLEPIMLRRYKVDVLSQLPAKFRSCLCLTGSDAAEAEKQRLREVLLTRTQDDDSESNDLENFGLEASDLFSYLENMNLFGDPSNNEIVGALATIRKETALQKLQPAIELLRDIMLSEKVVVFAHHRAVILELVEEFGDEAVHIIGGMDVASRSEAVQRFQEDPDVRIFVGSIRAAGTGLTLTAASQVVFLELDWSPGVMSQAEDRLHRVGQQNSVQVYYYVFKDTIDEWIARSLLDKQSNIAQILPESASASSVGYVFDFGKHEGLRLEDVPRNYVQFLLSKKVWRNRPSLWEALYAKGIIFEQPQILEEKSRIKKNTEEETEPTATWNAEIDVDYSFDFGKHNGKRWSDVPRSYRDWVMKEKVWKNRKNLRSALIDSGVIGEN